MNRFVILIAKFQNGKGCHGTFRKGLNTTILHHAYFFRSASDLFSPGRISDSDQTANPGN
jgi:hypothetical protein